MRRVNVVDEDTAGENDRLSFVKYSEMINARPFMVVQ